MYKISFLLQWRSVFDYSEESVVDSSQTTLHDPQSMKDETCETITVRKCGVSEIVLKDLFAHCAQIP